jgi:hypothetical protein
MGTTPSALHRVHSTVPMTRNAGFTSCEKLNVTLSGVVTSAEIGTEPPPTAGPLRLPSRECLMDER